MEWEVWSVESDVWRIKVWSAESGVQSNTGKCLVQACSTT